MMQFTEEQRNALTEYARNAIKQAEEARDEIPFGLSEEEEMEISLFAIALERLNAAAPQPVKLKPIIQISYTQDEITCMCNVRNDDIEAIRAAGYQVEE
ncbi:MAG: hypothetical protein E6868_08210 [Pantoea sp.]|uniref:hypothetical protein n=1 Tax=Pantoea sp. TaxID=69393 RepID=UPI0028FF6AC3|nr:hypothetical protein [Pantoea sp.]MDU1573219.1 hypothetical protein [Pantoea sp.]